MSGASPQLALPPAADVAAWLAQTPRRFWPNFPPSMEPLYLAETTEVRLREQYLSTLFGAASGLVLLPALWPLIPDAHAAVRNIWLMAGMPIGIAGAIAYRMPWLSVLAREWLSTLAAVAVGVAFAQMLAASVLHYPAVLLGGLMLLIVLGAAPSHMSVQRQLLLASSLVLIFASAVLRYDDVQPGEAVLLVALFAICSAFSVFTVWRNEYALRRSYAEGLRERLANSALSAQNEVLETLAAADPLTGLANRRAYDTALARAAQRGGGLALIVIDIDAFKLYNDIYGHTAGDACLVRVANCLADQLRGRSDFLARIGGEEFAVILHEPQAGQAPDAMALAERLRAAVAALGVAHEGGPAGRISISAGVAAGTLGAGGDPAAIFEAADRALYAAKHGGRNRVVLAQGALAAV